MSTLYFKNASILCFVENLFYNLNKISFGWFFDNGPPLVKTVAQITNYLAKNINISV